MYVPLTRYPKDGFCKAEISERDQLRIVRGHGFKMHYNHRQCARKACVDGYCKQHAKMAGVAANTGYTNT